MRPSIRLILPCLLLWSSVVCARQAIVVHADTAYEINGVDQIQSAVFGVTAYEGAPWPAMDAWRSVIAESGIACLGFPQSGGGAPDPQNKTPDQILAWYDSDAAVAAVTNGPLNGSVYLYGQVLPAVRRLGIEPMIYVFGGYPPFPETDEDFEKYGAMMAGYVGLLKRIDPGLRWVHVLNEPNAYFYKHGKGGADHARMFVAAASAIKRRCPDVMVGGPVNCWPPTWPPSQTGFPNWYQWDSYTTALIDAAGETLDFFDYH